ncbi:MAG: hypothetical protein KAI51_00770 [Candidatus Aenigmarchaeota archaeon]|nr:hypothetical protein [Candidatus Aenigmarchaeota archaeon]MCK5451942.1 hypothetical protein [Candidatus Aenigmarchaeota archaeon]
MYGDIGLDACAVIKIKNKVSAMDVVGRKSKSYSYALIKAKNVEIVPNLFGAGM